MTNKKYFFIGIGGVGMSSIAQYLYEKENTIPLDTVITLDHLTNPDKK